MGSKDNERTIPWNEDLLDELTQDGGNPGGENSLGEEDSPIKGLKAVVLSIDWEISDQSMRAFGEEIEQLKSVWAEDKILLSFLHVLAALGNYIRTARGKSHPESIRLFHSVYGNLEKVAMSPEMPEQTKRKLLSGEVNKYNELKVRLRGATAAKVSAKRDKGTAAGGPEGARPVAHVAQSGGAESLTGPAPAASASAGGPAVEKTPVPPHPEHEPVPEVDGLFDDLFREMIQARHPAEGDGEPGKAGRADQDEVGPGAPPAEDNLEGEREFISQRVDDASFPEVDKRLDDFFGEEEEAAVAQEEEGPGMEAGPEPVLTTAPEATVEDARAEAVIDLGAADEISAPEVDKRLDDFFGEEEEAAVAQEEEGPGMEAEPEPVLTAAPEATAEDAGAEAEIELGAADEISALEIEERLDDFFGEEEGAAAQGDRGEAPGKEEAAPLEALKAAILAIEREASDQSLLKFSKEITRARGVWKDDAILLIFLQLLGSLGKYVRAMSGEAHPETVRLLQAMFGEFEKTALSQDMDATTKQALLLEAIKEYIEWKEQTVFSALSLFAKTEGEPARQIILLGPEEEVEETVLLEPVGEED